MPADRPDPHNGPSAGPPDSPDLSGIEDALSCSPALLRARVRRLEGENAALRAASTTCPGPDGCAVVREAREEVLCLTSALARALAQCDMADLKAADGCPAAAQEHEWAAAAIACEALGGPREPPRDGFSCGAFARMAEMERTIAALRAEMAEIRAALRVPLAELDDGRPTIEILGDVLHGHLDEMGRLMDRAEGAETRLAALRAQLDTATEAYWRDLLAMAGERNEALDKLYALRTAVADSPPPWAGRSR